MCPVAFSSDGSLELGCSELAKAIRLVFDCHGKDFGMLDDAVFDIGRWRSSEGWRRLIGELSAVVE